MRDTGELTGEFTYRVSAGLSVDARDLPRLDRVLDDAVKAGADNISGVSFGIEDRSVLEAAAREKAVADAKARAQSLAALSGVELGEVVGVSQVIGGPGPIFDRGGAGLDGGGAPLQAGQLEVQVQVQVTFAIKQAETP